MIIELHKGMMNITAKDFSYGNIRNMYIGNQSGSGIQINTELEGVKDDIIDVCDSIAELLYRLQDLTESK